MIQYLFSEEFAPKLFESKHILLVGAGGLGCEVSKFLSISGFKQLDIVDLDIIEYSNLNRQIYFDENDMWKPKAEVTAQVLKNQIGKNIPHHLMFSRIYSFLIFNQTQSDSSCRKHHESSKIPIMFFPKVQCGDLGIR